MSVLASVRSAAAVFAAVVSAVEFRRSEKSFLLFGHDPPDGAISNLAAGKAVGYAVQKGVSVSDR